MKFQKLVEDLLNEAPAPAAPTPVKEPGTKPAPTPSPDKKPSRIPGPQPPPQWEPEPKAKKDSNTVREKIKQEIRDFLSKRGLESHPEDAEEELE